MQARALQLNKLKQHASFSVVIVGAGINGIGVFRDLSLQGVDCLLIDKGDFMSGASSAPSRMIHGGLRYLETGDFSLVMEGVRERNRLLQNAPHLVKPLPTTIPVFSRFGGIKSALLRFLGKDNVPARRGLLVIQFGLWLYDLFSRRAAGIPRSVIRDRQAARQQYGHLNSGILGTATYYDACISHPERLGIELIDEAIAAMPDNLAINYLALSSLDQHSLRFVDSMTGEVLSVSCDILINASGAWIDLTNAALNASSHFVGGTKGSHLVVDNPELVAALAGEMVYFEDGAGRVCLVYPFHGHVLIGTTDIPVDQPDGVRCDKQEERYLLRAVRKIFPGIRLNASYIRYRFSGVRPLVASDATITSAISRDHVIRQSTAGCLPVLSLVGGKWTTFRAFAEQATDLTLKQLAKSRRCNTTDLAIGGGKNFPRDTEAKKDWIKRVAEATDLPEARVELLLQRYGSCGEDIARYCVEHNEQALTHHSQYSTAEIQYLISHESVACLSDLILRRTLLAITGQLSKALLNELAAIMAEALGWDEAVKQQQLADCVTELEVNHGVAL